MQKLGFYKEQVFPENNGHQVVEKTDKGIK
jgi:hypothetical protein